MIVLVTWSGHWRWYKSMTDTPTQHAYNRNMFCWRSIHFCDCLLGSSTARNSDTRWRPQNSPIQVLTNLQLRCQHNNCQRQTSTSNQCTPRLPRTSNTILVNELCKQISTNLVSVIHTAPISESNVIKMHSQFKSTLFWSANHVNKFFNHVCKQIGQQQLTHQELACYASQPRQHNI